VFYNEWKTAPVFKNFMMKEFFIVANKGRPSMLSEIEILDVKLSGKAPEFLKIQKLDSATDDVIVIS
jgi:hypothetical protein